MKGKGMKKINKKGSATVYLIIALLVALGVIALIIKLNWARFKAETSFALTLIGIIIVLVLLIVLIIRHKIRKAKKERAKAKAEKEAAENEGS